MENKDKFQLRKYDDRRFGIYDLENNEFIQVGFLEDMREALKGFQSGKVTKDIHKDEEVEEGGFKNTMSNTEVVTKNKEVKAESYEVWQKYYEDGRITTEFVQDFDDYEKAQKFADGLNQDPDCEAWVKDLEENKEIKTESNWCGIEGIEHIWNGNWSDPQIKYKGHTYNEWDVQEYIGDAFNESDEGKSLEYGSEDWHTKFAKWCKENSDWVKSMIEELQPDDVVEENKEIKTEATGTDIAVKAIMAYGTKGKPLDEEWLNNEIQLLIKNTMPLYDAVVNSKRPAHSIAYDGLVLAINEKVEGHGDLTSKQIQAGFKNMGIDYKEVIKPSVEFVEQERKDLKEESKTLKTESNANICQDIRFKFYNLLSTAKKSFEYDKINAEEFTDLVQHLANALRDFAQDNEILLENKDLKEAVSIDSMRDIIKNAKEMFQINGAIHTMGFADEALSNNLRLRFNELQSQNKDINTIKNDLISCIPVTESVNVKKYVLTIKHDDGTVNITTTASSKEQAIKQVCNSEKCPESAILDIKELDLENKEIKTEDIEDLENDLQPQLSDDDEYTFDKEDELSNLHNNNESILESLQDLVGQEMSASELNVTLQNRFARYNELFILKGDLYNKDLDETQELVITDEDVFYSVFYDIIDVDSGIIKVVDVDEKY